MQELDCGLPIIHYLDREFYSGISQGAGHEVHVVSVVFHEQNAQRVGHDNTIKRPGWFAIRVVSKEGKHSMGRCAFTHTFDSEQRPQARERVNGDGGQQ